jgi:hypothetical protein
MEEERGEAVNARWREMLFDEVETGCEPAIKSQGGLVGRI